MTALERIELLLDPDSFFEMFSDMESFDILGFDDSKKSYSQKLQEA
jgi:acetyl-CoA carboxylase beta subunit